jgi:hypothetical protein
MPYCESCGAQISVNAKFCGVCGAVRTQPTQTSQVQPQTQPVQTQPAAQPKREKLSYYSAPQANAYVPPPPLPVMLASAAQPMTQPYIPQAQPVTQPYMAQPQPQPVMQPSPMPMQQPGGENAVGYIILRKPKSMGRWDTYTGVLTPQRLIFAQMTNQMINDAVKQSRDQAKAEGKGFFGQWGDQLRATFYYGRRYLSMPPDVILAETPGNFALNNSIVNEVKIKLKRDSEGHVHELEVEFHSAQGKYEFRMDENSESTDLLKRVYGDRVNMPFGYFSKAINIKF